MTRYLVVTKIPERQGLLGLVRARNVVEEAEAKDLDGLRAGLHVPLDGECLVVEAEHVVTVTARVVNEVIDAEIVS